MLSFTFRSINTEGNILFFSSTFESRCTQAYQERVKFQNNGEGVGGRAEGRGGGSSRATAVVYELCLFRTVSAGATALRILLFARIIMVTEYVALCIASCLF